MSDCFIIMPITISEEDLPLYSNDRDHFKHVLETLFVPAIKAANMKPISPAAVGSEVILANIIKNLSEAALVLCDMSSLNPNVFFEFGIRTALDKPIALVVDDKTGKIPFDINIINYHTYSSSPGWQAGKEVEKIARHIKEAVSNAQNRNPLWKLFGTPLRMSPDLVRLKDVGRLRKEDKDEIVQVLREFGNALGLGEAGKVQTLPGYEERPRLYGDRLRGQRGIQTADLIRELIQRVDAMGEDG